MLEIRAWPWSWLGAWPLAKYLAWFDFWLGSILAFTRSLAFGFVLGLALACGLFSRGRE